MTEDPFPIRGGRGPYTDEAEDTQGHGASYKVADAEKHEGDDAEGHMHRNVDAESAEGDDTEGHGLNGRV